MLSPFQRLLEDVLREELLGMGLDFHDVVDTIVGKRDGETLTIRFRGTIHDLDVVEPDDLPSRAALGAHLRRKLESALSRRGSIH